jgi:hypothetical protein
MNRSRGFGVRVVTMALAVSLGYACTERHTISRAPNGSYSPDRLARAKIVLRNGTSVKVNDVRIRDDSVIGTTAASRERAAFAVTEISGIESQEYSRTRTLFLLSAFAGTVLGIDLYTVGHR